jgi:hypothetical protein
MSAPEREDVSTPYEVVEGGGVWWVISGQAAGLPDVDGPFANNAEAWSWINRHTVVLRARMTVDYETTHNSPIGEPCPPVDNYQWAVVRRGAGFTFWRRISLTTEPQTRKLET